MSDIAVHRQKVNQAREDVKRMLGETEDILESEAPDYRRLTGLFIHMETACRSGFNQAYQAAFKHQEIRAEEERPA